MKRETYEMLGRIKSIGVSQDDAFALRRISMTLHRWHELECGIDSGGIDRGEDGRPYWYNSHTGKRSMTPMRDMERGALKRLAGIMARYPGLRAYVQGDPRGAALYLLRPEDAPVGQEDSHYSRGVACYA